MKALLKIFAERINRQEVENATEESDAYEDSRSNKDNEKERAKTTSTKYATVRDATDGISADCDDIVTFPQAVSLKSL